MSVNLSQPVAGGSGDPLSGIVQGATALGQAIRQGNADDAAIAAALGLGPAPAPKPAPSDNGPLFLIGGLLVLVGVVAVVLYVVRRKK